MAARRGQEQAQYEDGGSRKDAERQGFGITPRPKYCLVKGLEFIKNHPE
jgi:hypothetical protein